jgi:DNA-binding GntR family transcriptional regulator
MVPTAHHNLINKFHAPVEPLAQEIQRTSMLKLAVKLVVAVFTLLRALDQEPVQLDNVWIAYLGMFALVKLQRLNQSTTPLIEVTSVLLVTTAPRILI